MILSDSQPGLLALLKQQYAEGEADLQRRVDKLERSYRAWRGLYSYQDEQSERTGVRTTKSRFWDEDDYSIEPEKTEGSADIYERETFRQCETLVGVMDEAYTRPSKPFEIVLPEIFYGMPDYNQMKRRRMDLKHITAWVQDAYRQGGKAADREALRHMVVFGTGITYSRPSASWKAYPRGEKRCIPRWRFRVDPRPDGGEIENARFAMVEYTYTLGEALTLWPEDAEDLKSTAGKSSSSELDTQKPEDLLRKEVVVQEIFGRYDFGAIEEAYDDAQRDGQDAGTPKMYRMVMLGLDNGLSEVMLGKPADLPKTLPGMPFSAYRMVRSVIEKGIDGIGAPELMEEDQVALNALTNDLDTASGLVSQQGGIYDAILDNGLEVPLSAGFERGEWKPVNVGPLMPRIKEHIFSVAELYNAQALAVIANQHSVRQMAVQRTLGVTDQMSGISAKTESNTLGEADMLMAQSNRRVSLYASSVDDDYRRSQLIFCLACAEALKGDEDRAIEEEREPKTIYYYDQATETPGIIRSESFDESWEIHLKAGATVISDKAKLQQLGNLMALGAKLQLPDEARQLLRRMTVIAGEDPDDLVRLQPKGMAPPMQGPSPQDPAVVPIQVSPETQMAQMAQAAMAQVPQPE